MSRRRAKPQPLPLPDIPWRVEPPAPAEPAQVHDAGDGFLGVHERIALYQDRLFGWTVRCLCSWWARRPYRAAAKNEYFHHVKFAHSQWVKQRGQAS